MTLETLSTPDESGIPRAPRCGPHRPHRARRTRRITIAYDDTEYAAVLRAAGACGLTPTGYVAETALAEATGHSPPELQPLRDALGELVAARGQVRRFAVNVNQAVRELNTNGTPPEWLATAVAITGRAVTRLDQTAADLHRLIH